MQLRLYSSVLGSGVVRKMLSATGSDFGDTVSGLGGVSEAQDGGWRGVATRVLGALRRPSPVAAL